MTTHLSSNPASGERLRWHVRSSDSEGRLVRAEMWCAPGGGVPHVHVHPRSEERFEVLAGRIAVKVGDERVVAGPGDHVELPAGVPHCWTVEPGDEAHFFLEVDQPGDFEEQIETLFALGRGGALGPAGRPSLLVAACLTNLETGHLASPPVAVQRALFGVLTRIARLTGHAGAVARARAEARTRLAAPAAVTA